MTEGSIKFESTFTLDYDPGIFFVPGFGAKISQPNVGSIFSLSGALGQATSLFEKAKSLVDSASGGNFSFDANAVKDFAVNTAVGAAKEALGSAIPSEVSQAASFLSQFDPQQQLSISAFNTIASSISSPQKLVSQVADLGSKALGSLSSLASSAVSSVVGSLASTAAGAVGGAVSRAVGGSLGGIAGSLAQTVTNQAISSLTSSLGPQAAKLAGGALPDAKTWSTVFGESFNPDLTPFVNLSLSQLVPPLGQVIEQEVNGTLFGKAVNVSGVNVPVLGGISI